MEKEYTKCGKVVREIHGTRVHEKVRGKVSTRKRKPSTWKAKDHRPHLSSELLYVISIRISSVSLSPIFSFLIQVKLNLVPPLT